MKEKFARIPEPLRRQILFRMGIGFVSVILLITALLAGGDWRRNPVVLSGIGWPLCGH